ncbi:hypothetical protein IT568_10050 [bacterium]|nr:hypothetical protein [bacterium]
MNPLKDIFSVPKTELPRSLMMSFVFFLVITVFWILKPIKKSLFLSFYKESGFTFLGINFNAEQSELLAKILNLVVAFFAVWAFSLLANKFRREKLVYIFSAFFILTLVVYSQLISLPSDVTVWTFYLYGDLFSTLMVATFFAFLNDSVTPENAKKLYGLIGFGGVFGGVFSTTTLKTLQKAEVLSSEGFLLASAGVMVLIILFSFFASKKVSLKLVTEAIEKKTKENPALEGGKLVFSSKYLLSIVAIVGLYEMVSTIMDFQFSSAIVNLVPKEKIGDAFATAFAATNIVAMIVQLFFTSFVMNRFGVGIALLVLPVCALSGSVGFLFFPSVLTGSLLNTADNGFSYSINQSAKETLYVPTSQDEKYKAKAFIDMFVQRFAKALAVGFSLLITLIFTDFSTIPYLSVLSVVLLLLWILAVRFAGRKFEELTKY